MRVLVIEKAAVKQNIRVVKRRAGGAAVYGVLSGDAGCETPRTPAAVRGTQPKPPHPAAFCKAQDAAVLMRPCGDSRGSGVLSAWGKPVCG